MSSFSLNHFHISPAVIIKYFVSDFTFLGRPPQPGMQAPFVFCQQSWGGCSWGLFKGFQCHCNERKEEKKSEGKSARERGREGGMEKRREGGKEAAPASPSRRRDAGLGPGADTAPRPHQGARRPRNFPLGSGCHFPRSRPLPRRRPRRPHPVPSRSPSRRRGPAPTSARRRAAASRAQSSGRVFQICKRGAERR